MNRIHFKRVPATPEDTAIVDRWDFDPRYMACGTVNSYEKERLQGDMQNSQGIVGCVKHRIALAHDNGAELVTEPTRHDDPFFSPSRIAIY